MDDVGPMPDAKGWLGKLAELNDYLIGAPVGILLFFFAIGIALMMRKWSVFPNRAIMPSIVVSTTILFCAGAPRGELEIRLWVVRNILIGAIIGVAAIFAHLWVAKKLPSVFDSEPEPPKKPE